jgi:hypothetical protein
MSIEERRRLRAEREALWKSRDSNYGKVPVSVAPQRVINPRALGKQLVFAAYKDDLTWLTNVKMPVMVYSKSPVNRPVLPNVQYVDQPNLGREASAYFAHIVSNYDRLAEQTYFVQGGALKHAPDLVARIRHDYISPTSLTARYLPHHPKPEITALDQVEQVHGHEVMYGDALYAGSFCGSESDRAWMREVWDHWFACSAPDRWVFGYGAQWVVPRAAVLARPRGFWEWALAEVTKPEHQTELTLASAWAVELIWGYLWGDPAQYPLRWAPEPHKSFLARFQGMGRVEEGATSVRVARKGCGCGGNKPPFRPR